MTELDRVISKVKCEVLKKSWIPPRLSKVIKICFKNDVATMMLKTQESIKDSIEMVVDDNGNKVFTKNGKICDENGYILK